MRCALHSTRLLWLALLLSLLGSVARAAGSAPSCDENLACQKLAAQGMDFFGAGRYREAEESFAQAYALRADPALLYNLGRTAHKGGHPREAVTYYQRFLDVGAAGDAEQRRKTEQYLSQAQKEATQPLATPALPMSGPTSAAPAPVQLLPPQIQPSSKPARVPLYRKPWLWAIVGVAVAGVAVGLGVGLEARRPDLGDTVVTHPFGN